MKEIMTHGIRARAIETSTAKSIACPLATRDAKTKKIGKGAVVVSNFKPGFALLKIDSYMYWWK